jgi:hypothetical protein
MAGPGATAKPVAMIDQCQTFCIHRMIMST